MARTDQELELHKVTATQRLCQAASTFHCNNSKNFASSSPRSAKVTFPADA